MVDLRQFLINFNPKKFLSHGLKFIKNRTIGDDFLDDLLNMLVQNDLVDVILKADDDRDASFTEAINYIATQFGKRREKV